jgi:starch-binding outer membrane protein, SusD/RagB family
MKNKFICLSLALLLGCADKVQQDSINPNLGTPATFFKTELDAVSSVNAVYTGLIVDGFFNRMGAVMADGRSDELSSRSPWDVLSTVAAFVMPSTSFGSQIIWSDCYSLINRANQTIEGVSTMTGIDATLKSRVLGQAYFLRAFAYFHLTLFYNNGPLVTKVPVTQDDRFPKSSTKDEIWTQVKADLEQAKALLPIDYNSVTGIDKGQNQRISKGAAMALLGRVHLYAKEWAAAEAEFDAVIALNKYSLAANYADNFTENPGIEQSNPESIFQVEFTNDQSPDLNWGGVPSATWRQFSAIAPTYGPKGFGFFDFYPTPWLYNEMKLEKTKTGGTDPRLFATILSYEPTEGYGTAYGKPWLAAPNAGAGYLANEIFVKKFTRADQGVSDEIAKLNSGINYPVIRYGDVLLMAAEAKNELNKTAAAATLIQKVRNRAKLPDREVEFAAYTQAQMRDQLAHERVTECAIEGKRINDIIRWGWLSDPTKLALLKAHDPEFNNLVTGHEYLPVPQADLDINPNLSKNSAN